MIDAAEDREKFKQILLDELKLRQPPNGMASTPSRRPAKLRSESATPSSSGPASCWAVAAMEICYDDTQSRRYMIEAINVSPDHPVLIDKFLEDAIEVDVDAISDGETTLVGGVMEHIEEAGVHSGRLVRALCPRSHCPAGDASKRSSEQPTAWPRPLQGPRPDEHSVRGQARTGMSRCPAKRTLAPHVCPRSQPARQPHITVRVEGDRPATGEAWPRKSWPGSR